MKKTLTIAAIVLLISICSIYGRFEYPTCVIDGFLFPPEEKSFTLSDGHSALYYRLRKGSGDPRNAIFFVSGSGYNSLRYYLRRYFRYLPDGYDIYALQKRHVSAYATQLSGPAPKEFHDDNHFARWTADQTEFVSKTAGAEGKKYSNVIIFGVSEGGNVAACIAANLKAVTHLAVIGSGGYKQADELKALYKGMDLDAEYKRISADSNSVSLSALGQTYKYWNSVLYVDPIKYYGALEIPILAGMGEKDRSVPIASGRFLREEFEKIGKKNLTFIEYKDSGHNLVASDGMDNKKDFFERLDRMINSGK